MLLPQTATVFLVRLFLRAAEIYPPCLQLCSKISVANVRLWFVCRIVIVVSRPRKQRIILAGTNHFIIELF